MTTYKHLHTTWRFLFIYDGWVPLNCVEKCYFNCKYRSFLFNISVCCSPIPFMKRVTFLKQRFCLEQSKWYYSFIVSTALGPRGGGRGGLQKCFTGGFVPGCKPLHFYSLSLTGNPFIYALHRKWYLCHIPTADKWRLFSWVCSRYFERPFKVLFFSHGIPTLTYTSSVKKVPLSGGVSPFPL